MRPPVYDWTSTRALATYFCKHDTPEGKRKKNTRWWSSVGISVSDSNNRNNLPYCCLYLLYGVCKYKCGCNLSLCKVRMHPQNLNLYCSRPGSKDQQFYQINIFLCFLIPYRVNHIMSNSNKESLKFATIWIINRLPFHFRGYNKTHTESRSWRTSLSFSTCVCITRNRLSEYRFVFQSQNRKQLSIVNHLRLA